jgi:hypothetical protein
VTAYRDMASELPNPVVQWRRDNLLGAGFDFELAVELAHSRVDLHALLELVDRGCPAELAARILAPLDDPRWPL